MKRIFLIMGILFPSILQGQTGEFYPKMPFKYETPSPGMLTSLTNERGEKMWNVYAAKNNINVYSDEKCQNIKGTEEFLQTFVVWKENEDAVRLVKNIGSGALAENYRFTENAVDVGWARKRDLILGQKCLCVVNSPVRAFLRRTPEEKNLPVNMPGFKGKIAENGFGVYFVIKQESDAWLLSITDIMHEGLSNESVFWVERSNITTVKSNIAFVPNWKMVETGQKLYTFRNGTNITSSDTVNAAMKIYSNNPFQGYFYVGNEDKSIKVFNLLITSIDTQFIRSSDPGFLKAIFMDVKQFTEISNFTRILSSSPTKETLRSDFRNYFSNLKIDTNKPEIRSMNIAEMFGYSLGLDFSEYSGKLATPIAQLKENDVDAYYEAFGAKYEKMLSEKEIAMNRFYSGISYYWLPQDLLSLDILSKLTLFKPKAPPITGDIFKEFNIFYIDHSAPESEKGYDQTNVEILRLYKNLKLIWTAKEEVDNDIGNLIFFSSGIDPIIAQDEPGFEQVAGQMRNSASIRPDKFNDKLLLENRLITEIKAVTGKIVINIDVSNSFYQTELDGRAYFLKEFVERVKVMLTGANTQISVLLYYNNPKNPALESRLRAYCDKMNSLTKNINYSVYKIN